jgi:hypothetical protein
MTRRDGIGAAGIAVTAAGVLANLLAYVVPMLGARTLTPADLSALVTLLAMSAIAGVASTGLQIAVAVHRARFGPSSTTRSALLTVAVTTGAMLVALPVAVLVLRLPVPATVLAGVSTIGVVAAGRWLGEMQGDQRFLPLAAGLAILAGGRYGGVVVGLVWDAGLTGSLLIGAVTAILVLPVLHILARRPGVVAVGSPLAARAVLTAGWATLGMLVVSYADVLLARRFLSADVSGAYMVGAVLTKGALWAPQVVTVLALPRLAQGNTRTLRLALALVGLSGLLLTAAAAVNGTLAFRLAGGADYEYVGPYAWVFAATGSLYGVVFVLVNAQVAADARWPSGPLWIVTAAFAAAAWLVVPHTLQGIAFGALAAATAALISTGVLVGLRMRRPVTDPQRERGTVSVG